MSRDSFPSLVNPRSRNRLTLRRIACEWRFAPILLLGSVFLIGVVIGDELSDRNIKSRLVSLAADMFAKPVERVVYVEKMPIGARIRDVISFRDGRIAMMLDTSHIAVL